MRVLTQLSQFVHRWIGLVLIPSCLILAISGILIAHPEWIRHLEAPAAIVPGSYHPENWNRMIIRESQELRDGNQRLLLVAGKAGVLMRQTPDGPWTLLNEGYPHAAYDRDTRALAIAPQTAAQSSPRILAATRNSLHLLDWTQQRWKTVHLERDENSEFVDLDFDGKRFIIASQRHIYTADPEFGDIHRLSTQLQSDARVQWPAFRVLHEFHEHLLLGTPGKILVDVLGLGLIVLSLSAMVIWYRLRGPGSLLHHRPGLFCTSWNCHLHMGAILALFLTATALSGAFLRPPLILALLRGQMDADHPALERAKRSPLGAPIQKILTRPQHNQILIATTAGLHVGPLDGRANMQPVSAPVPIHGMGLTVLENLSDAQLLLGSFSGLWRWDLRTNRASPIPRPGMDQSNPFQGNDLTTAVLLRDGTLQWRVDYHDGLLAPRTGATAPDMPMPDWLARTPMSLWHYAFEWHNGRIAQPLLGIGYMLLIPLTGLGLAGVCLTGLWDWMMRRR